MTTNSFLSIRRQILGCGMTVALAVALTALASADSGIRNAWLARYPTSQSFQASSCALCHASTSQTNRYNAYGYRLKQLLDTGSTNTAAFAATEALDSDGDPTGASNLYEILHDAQPGWTTGANNTTYTGAGVPTTGVTAPASITGVLDPALGTNYCGPAVPNSTGSSSSISATGSVVVATNNMGLTASNLPNNSFGFFLTSRTQGLVLQPGGSQGRLCLGGSIGRYVGPGQIKNSGAMGSFSLALNLNQTPTPTGLVAIVTGETWNFQAWHRDSIGGVATSNFTDGLSATFQ